MIEPVLIRSAVVSTDGALRNTIRSLAEKAGIEIVHEIGASFTDISAGVLQDLRRADPQLVFIDLGDEPALGIRLAQFISDHHPSWKLIALGTDLSPELLVNAMRAGVSEYMPRPVDPGAVHEAVERVRRRSMGSRETVAQADLPLGRILALFSAKGGSGLTTIATNLAVQLHRMTNKSVLLVDLDLELGETAVFLGMQPRFNFVDLIRNFHRMDADLLASYIERHDSGVQLLSAPFQPEKAEAVGGEQINRVLQFLRQHYDFIVIDSSKSFSPATLAGLAAADEIHLITTADLPSLRNIKRLLPLLQRVTAAPQDRLRLILNRYHEDDLISVSEIENALEMNVFWKLRNDYEAVIQSINAGKPLVLSSTSPFAQDIGGLAANVAGLEVHQNGKKGGIRFLRNLFKRQPSAANRG